MANHHGPCIKSFSGQCQFYHEPTSTENLKKKSKASQLVGDETFLFWRDCDGKRRCEWVAKLSPSKLAVWGSLPYVTDFGAEFHVGCFNAKEKAAEEKNPLPKNGERAWSCAPCSKVDLFGFCLGIHLDVFLLV